MSIDDTRETLSDKKMSLSGHLAELRTCLIVSVIAIIIGFAISFYFSEDLLKALTDLINSDQKHSFVFLSPAEALWANFKIALFSGISIAMPVFLYQLWRFISPGFKENERKYALPFLITGVVSFVIGLIFELPIAIIFLTKTGILTTKFLTKNRKYAILINFIVSAILTPTPDIFNQLFMAVPLIALYELGIIGAKIFCREAGK